MSIYSIVGVPEDLIPYVQATEMQEKDDFQALLQAERRIGTPDYDACSSGDTSDSEAADISFDISPSTNFNPDSSNF